ncbi:MAG: helical backbone metal receptor [Vicinamibacterales bacterium]
MARLLSRRRWLATVAGLCLCCAWIHAQAAIPSRIVSTSPSITETLFALGLGDRVVGVSTYCRYPEQVRALPKVGTFLKPEPETIARLKPDLVYVHAGPNTAVQQLTALGLRTAIVDSGTLPNVFATIRQISAAAAVPERGAALVRDLQTTLQRVEAAVAGKPRRRVLVIVGRRTGTLTDMIAVGPGSYLHDLIAIAGGENVMSAVSLEYPRISMETVISLKPDVLIDVGEMGETPESSERRRQITASLWANQPLVTAGTQWERPRCRRRGLRRSRSTRGRRGARHGRLVPGSDGAVSVPRLRVRDVGWRAPGGADILRRVSFDVKPGEFLAIMGRNGAGKSTLLDILASLRTPSSGSVELEGRLLDQWSLQERARIVAHLPQMLRADLSARADAIVQMGRYPHAARWFESDDDVRIAHDAMERCECLEFRSRSLATLSGGERQRVYLAACLAQRGSVLLLDEPATFLDVDQQLHCFEVVRAEAERGAACLAVTHDVNLALTFCTRLLVLAEHEIARDVSTAEARNDPSWLRAFSARLEIERGPSGAWVRYR